MLFKIEPNAHSWAIIGSCVGTLTIILVAGLWPFHSPKNDVTWLPGENGIRISSHGCLVSSSSFRAYDSKDGSSGSLELWIKPALATKGRRTILAFEGPGDDSTAFSLQQDGNTLIIQRKNTDKNGVFHTAEFALREALVGDSRTELAITFGPHDTKVYRNGILAATAKLIGNSTPVFAGRLVLGNFLNVGGTWPGQIYGLAIYGRELGPEAVISHYENWNNFRRPTVTEMEQPVALYLFDERAGRIVHDQLGSHNSLLIPERYLVLHPQFLTVPWRHFRSTPGYWKDVAINIIGFVPFGFSFFAYFSTVRITKKAALLVVLLGFFTSLTIEVLQAWLPTRSSGINDLITNTLGTGLGVLLYRSSLKGIIGGK
jgi:VanZ like family/Concanavalin A-like lectin/glucanases superfamily